MQFSYKKLSFCILIVSFYNIDVGAMDSKSQEVAQSSAQKAEAKRKAYLAKRELYLQLKNDQHCQEKQTGQGGVSSLKELALAAIAKADKACRDAYLALKKQMLQAGQENQSCIPSLQELTLAAIAKEKFQAEIDGATTDTVLATSEQLRADIACLGDVDRGYSESILKYIRAYYPQALPMDDYEIKGGLLMKGKLGPLLITLNAEKKTYGYRRRVMFWSADPANLVAYVAFDGQSIETIAVDATGTKLAVGSEKGTIQLWDISTLQEDQPNLATMKLVGMFEQSPKSAGKCIERLLFITDKNGNDVLLSASIDKTITLWDPSLELVNRQGTLDQTYALRKKNHIGVVDVSDGFFNVLNINAGAVKSWFWIPEVSVLIVGKVNGAIEFFQIAYFKNNNGLTYPSFISLSEPEHRSAITALKVSPDNSILITGAQNGFITLWDISNFSSVRCINTFKGHEGAIKDFELIDNAQVLASISCDGTMKTWNIETPIKPYLLKVLRGLDTPIKVGALSNGTLLSISTNAITKWLKASVEYTLCMRVLEKTASTWAPLFIKKDFSTLKALIAGLSAGEKMGLSALCETAQVYGKKS